MSDRNSSRKPSKGASKRYTAAQKAKIVRLSERVGVATAVERTGALAWLWPRGLPEQDPSGVRRLPRALPPFLIGQPPRRVSALNGA